MPLRFSTAARVSIFATTKGPRGAVLSQRVVRHEQIAHMKRRPYQHRVLRKHLISEIAISRSRHT